MIKWLIIGLVIWYFYRRYKKRSRLGRRPDERYNRDDDFRDRQDQRTARPVDEDDYIDYEEVK